MLDNIKIIFMDLDGTSLNNVGQFSEYTRNVINKVISKNIYVVICSGRSNSDMIKKSNDLCSSPIIISSNGSMIFDYKENKKIYESSISPKVLGELWDFAISNIINITFNGTYNRFKSRYSKKDGIIISNVDEIDENITQIVADSASFDSIEQLRHIVLSYEDLDAKNFGSQIFSDFSINEQGYELDIVNKNNNKGIAIKRLLNYLHLDKQCAICFGDQMNDLQMFEACGTSVAMDNGAQELKRIATYVTSSNEDNGVAKFIEDYLL